ncbi:hypothetical protein AAVH_18412, partial [Aphelenchoides avenae]
MKYEGTAIIWLWNCSDPYARKGRLETPSDFNQAIRTLFTGKAVGMTSKFTFKYESLTDTIRQVEEEFLRASQFGKCCGCLQIEFDDYITRLCRTMRRKRSTQTLQFCYYEDYESVIRFRLCCSVEP